MNANIKILNMPGYLVSTETGTPSVSLKVNLTSNELASCDSPHSRLRKRRRINATIKHERVDIGTSQRQRQKIHADERGNEEQKREMLAQFSEMSSHYNRRHHSTYVRQDSVFPLQLSAPYLAPRMLMPIVYPLRHIPYFGMHTLGEVHVDHPALPPQNFYFISPHQQSYVSIPPVLLKTHPNPATWSQERSLPQDFQIKHAPNHYCSSSSHEIYPPPHIPHSIHARVAHTPATAPPTSYLPTSSVSRQYSEGREKQASMANSGSSNGGHSQYSHLSLPDGEGNVVGPKNFAVKTIPPVTMPSQTVKNLPNVLVGMCDRFTEKKGGYADVAEDSQGGLFIVNHHSKEVQSIRPQAEETPSSSGRSANSFGVPDQIRTVQIFNKHSGRYNLRYVCSVCGSMKAGKCHILSHLRSHTGEQPFKCTICSRRFAHKSNCVRHLLHMHGVKIPSC
mmetsp:Transcript_37342/g.59969  ORF Transcript_37342/g.59969 Transcript_37342/m.59969 type:complete len:450 (+) Transcript_37342:311-1660(+)